MHSNHQDEREREIQALKKHFENESSWERWRDALKSAWIMVGKAIVINWVINLSLVGSALAAFQLGFGPLTVWLVGAFVSFVALRLYLWLRPGD